MRMGVTMMIVYTNGRVIRDTRYAHVIRNTRYAHAISSTGYIRMHRDNKPAFKFVS